MEGQVQEQIPRAACIDHLRANGPGLVQPVVAYFYNVSIDDMRAGTRRGARAAFARQIAMYLMHVIYGLSMSEVAGNFGRDRSTACHACHRIEDLRDDPGFDRQLLHFENLLRAAADIEVTG
jgi:chromosomal replication initiation ATPase DnaA